MPWDQKVDLECVLRNAIRLLPTSYLDVLPLWAVASEITGLGSTSAKALCVEFGWQPDASAELRLPPPVTDRQKMVNKAQAELALATMVTPLHLYTFRCDQCSLQAMCCYLHYDEHGHEMKPCEALRQGKVYRLTPQTI